MEPERAAVRRIAWLMLSLSILGFGIAWIMHGPAAGAGFLIGSAISWLSFRSFKGLTDALGNPARRRRKHWFLAILMGGRYLLLGVLGYVIVKYFEINLLAALAGLLVSAAALTIEILYELIDGT